MTSSPQLVWDVRAQLGEGPIWLPHEQALRFVDIKGGRIHRHTPSSDSWETVELGGQPSFIVGANNGGLVVGSQLGIYAVEHNRLGDCLANPIMPTHNRTNDGAVDCYGRLWFGTMDDREQLPTGRLYCFERGELYEMGCNAIVTNGPALSPDGRVLYHVDSAQRTIWRYPVLDGPGLGRGDVFLRFDEADGYPDGIVIDSEGCLWVALWDGWSVRRYAPDGTLLLSVALPCARVTKLALGGADLRTAYVTTARIGLSQAQLATQPHAGGLFAFEAPAPGLAPHLLQLA